MYEYEDFNFTNVTWKMRGKNGEAYLNKDGQVYIKRSGWFDTPYQLLTRGATLFTVDEVEDIVIKEPGLARGYIDFFPRNKRKARVWLTNPYHLSVAQTMKERIEEKRKKSVK
ncbi:MAG: hypothetical protein IKE21_03570 [Erysipelotrichaceae bacterium]|nr:hypothetical protein [Erysipelotrichaceae bacterium]